MTNFEKVGLFMKTFGQEVKTKPSLSNDKINNTRNKQRKILSILDEDLVIRVFEKTILLAVLF